MVSFPYSYNGLVPIFIQWSHSHVIVSQGRYQPYYGRGPMLFSVGRADLLRNPGRAHTGVYLAGDKTEISPSRTIKRGQTFNQAMSSFGRFRVVTAQPRLILVTACAGRASARWVGSRRVDITSRPCAGAACAIRRQQFYTMQPTVRTRSCSNGRSESV